MGKLKKVNNGEEQELKGLGAMGKKTPFYRDPRIQPLPVQVVHERYYRSGERYYRLSGSSSRRQREQKYRSGSAARSGTTVQPSGTTAKENRAIRTLHSPRRASGTSSGSRQRKYRPSGTTVLLPLYYR